MAIAKHTLELEWKEFNVSLDAVNSWMQANAGEEYCGLSGNDKLQIHFENEPSAEEKEAIADYWEALDEESDEAVSYQSAEQIKAAVEADKAAKKAAASAKLIALGLSQEEIDALKA